MHSTSTEAAHRGTYVCAGFNVPSRGSGSVDFRISFRIHFRIVDNRYSQRSVFGFGWQPVLNVPFVTHSPKRDSQSFRVTQKGSAEKGLSFLYCFSTTVYFPRDSTHSRGFPILFQYNSDYHTPLPYLLRGTVCKTVIIIFINTVIVDVIR